MHTFIAHARQRRLAIATSAVLVLMAIHGAAPAIAGGASKSIGDIDSQGTPNLFGSGNASGGGSENQGTLPLYTSQMEKISGVAQAALPTIGFETVEGMLGDGDEVYLNTGQLADLYQFSIKAPKTTYTLTAASINFPVALTLSGAADEVLDTSSGSGGNNAGGTGGFPVVKAASNNTENEKISANQAGLIDARGGKLILLSLILILLSLITAATRSNLTALN